MKEITPEEVATLLLEDADVTIIDVRESEEVATGIIPGAIHIPLGELHLKVQDLDKANNYIIVCRSGNRSGHATLFLESLGYDASNMVGGMLEWQGHVC